MRAGDVQIGDVGSSPFAASISKGSDPALRERHVPVLILTAEHSEMMLNVVRQVGAADIAHKPVSAMQLRQRMERLVGIRFA